MKRMHVMLRVADLADSTRFYAALFGTEPSLTKPGYAKWMLEDPRVNFSIAEGGDALGVEHLGIQAESTGELAELRDRIDRAGGVVEHEGETTCCYHRSDKTWVTDAQGVSWEAFLTHGEADSFAAPEAVGRSGACCGPECCAEDSVAAAG